MGDVLESGARPGGDSIALNFNAREVGVGQRYDDSTNASVADQEVGATTQQEHRDATQVGDLEGAGQGVVGTRFDEEVGRSAHPQRGASSQRFVASDQGFRRQHDFQIAEGVGNVFGMRGRGLNGRIDRFLTESERGVHAASLKGIQRCAVGRVRELATLRMAWVNGWRSCSRMLSAMAEAASGRSACFKACCMEFRSAES